MNYHVQFFRVDLHPFRRIQQLRYFKAYREKVTKSNIVTTKSGVEFLNVWSGFCTTSLRIRVYNNLVFVYNGFLFSSRGPLDWLLS